MLTAEGTEKKNHRRNSGKPSWSFTIGLFFVLLSLVIFSFTYYPLISLEIKYSLSKPDSATHVAGVNGGDAESSDFIKPVDSNFGIVIPKIEADSKVIADVDWRNPADYQNALSKGVAHARGTSYPGQQGNIFLFAHSGTDFLEAARYNAVFYLLNKLEPDDPIFLFYKGKKISYAVSEKRIVGAGDIEYVEGNPDRKTITLMTCWPPGTTWKRLLVVAHEI